MCSGNRNELISIRADGGTVCTLRVRIHKWGYCVCTMNRKKLMQTGLSYVHWWWERVNDLVLRIQCGQIGRSYDMFIYTVPAISLAKASSSSSSELPSTQKRISGCLVFGIVSYVVVVVVGSN